MTRKVLLIKNTGIFKVYRIFFYLYFYGVSFAKEWILRQVAGPPATQLELWTRWKWYLLPYWGDQKETRLVVVSLQVKKPGFFTMESLSFPIVTAGCGCISRLPLKVTASQIVLSTGWFTATKCQRLSMAYLSHVLYSVQSPLLFKLYMFSCLFWELKTTSVQKTTSESICLIVSICFIDHGSKGLWIYLACENNRFSSLFAR